MSKFEEEISTDDWKKSLRSEIINGLMETGNKRILAQQNVGYYYKCQAPAFLYKYYKDNEWSLENLNNGKMWFSAPCNFNDIFDCSITVDEKELFKDALNMSPYKMKIRAGSSAWKDLKDFVHREVSKGQSIFENLRGQMGVACLSESYNSLLMWAHYANNHCGICVEYELLEINKQLGYSPVPIVYSNERACFRNLNSGFYEKDAVKLFFEAITSKSIEWSYEREWRIVQDQKACGEKWNLENKGALLDMIRPVSITLGCEARPEFEKKIQEYCQTNKINLYKMEKDTLYYQLNRKSIMEF